MAFLQELSDVLNLVRGQISKPISVKKGEQFKEFVENTLFPDSKYILNHKTLKQEIPGSDVNMHRFIVETSDPDFKFCSRDTDFTFWVEAKFQSYFYKNGFIVCEPWKLIQYHRLARRHPLFFALGVGGTPYDPKHVYLVPFTGKFYSHLYRSLLRKFQVHGDRAIDSFQLKTSAHVVCESFLQNAKV